MPLLLLKFCHRCAIYRQTSVVVWQTLRAKTFFLYFIFSKLYFLGIGCLHSVPVNLIYTTFGLININKKYSFAGTVAEVMWVLSHDIAQIVSRWLLTAEARVPARSVHVEFVLDEEALGQVSVRVVLYPLSALLNRGSPHSCIIWGMNNSPVVARSLETTV
jgi:hypothetical protein